MPRERSLRLLIARAESLDPSFVIPVIMINQEPIYRYFSNFP